MVVVLVEPTAQLVAQVVVVLVQQVVQVVQEQPNKVLLVIKDAFLELRRFVAAAAAVQVKQAQMDSRQVTVATVAQQALVVRVLHMRAVAVAVEQLVLPVALVVAVTV